MFQTSVLNKYRKQLDKKAVDNGYTAFTAYFHDPVRQENIRQAKEEQFQEGFLRELFVKILGYTLNPEPDFNLTTELKNTKDAKKTDGAVLKDGKALAVIELKGTDTKDLDKINQQAFNYKNNHAECVYVVTSNFEKLRFFIHNAVEHIEFDLFSLTPSDFELLWLCLQADNLLNGVPLKIKEESVVAEEAVTKKLYKDYTQFKNDVWQNMVHNHPEMDQLMLYKKSQKLLDRFLFVFFAEDSGLLPPNSITRMVERYDKLIELDAEKSLYAIFQQFFGYINTGRKGKVPQDDIFAYNGGLFLPDEVLDVVTIDDDLLRKHVLTLTAYDFQSEVDVNILGHIFENSLNEIENVTAQLEGQEVDKSKTKRKKDGVFYTPKYITKYIVDNTLGKLCDEKKAELNINDERFGEAGKRTQKGVYDLQAYRDWLLGLKICDPACGSGAFLNQALEFLMDEHRYLDELTAQYHKVPMVLSDVEAQILEQNIYGVDINEESVEIAKLSLWLRTAQRGRKLTSLNNNLKCGNSLIDDANVAGEKAFNWQNEFPKVFEKGGFDVVIGNPPYVQHRKLFHLSGYFKNNYGVYTGTSDLSVYFFEKGLDILASEGFLGYINTNKFFNTEYGIPLRELLARNQIHNLINFEQVAIFEGALVSSTIITMQKKEPSNDTGYAEFEKEYINAEKFEVEREGRKRPIKSDYLKHNAWIFEDPKTKKLIDKIRNSGASFKNIEGIKINRGVTTGYDDAFIIPQEKYGELLKKSVKNEEILKPLLKGRHIKRYWLDDSALWLLNSHNGLKNKIDPIDLSNEYPWLYDHLVKVNEETGGKVENRSDKGTHWTNLRNCAFLEEFEKEKVVWGLISGDWSFAYDDKRNYLTSASYFLTSNKIPVKFFLGLLNSRLTKFFFENVGEMTAGGAYVLKKTSIEKLILPQNYESRQNKIVDEVDNIMNCVSDFSQLQSNFIDLLQSKFDVEKLTMKLRAWHELEFKDFLQELKKSKVQLGLSEEAEWMQYFNEQKAKAQVLQQQINQTDKEIDQMVYELYGLTEEEIKIVEGDKQ